MSEDPKILEARFWNDLIHSKDWRYFQNVVLSRKDYLEKQALLAIAKRDNDKAFGFTERADEWRRILQLVSDRIDKLGGM